MIYLHAGVWGAMVSAHVNEEGYEITLPQWSGRQTDVSSIDALILFLQTVKSAATPAEWLAPTPDTEEDIKERTILADMKKEEDAAWYEAATEEELASQSSDSRDLEDFFDEDDDDNDW